VAPPFRECQFDIMYAEGISKEGDVLDLGVELDLIEKRGSFYSYNGERLAQGRENAKQALIENPALCFEIENAIRRETGLSELDFAPPFSFSEEDGAPDRHPEAIKSSSLPDEVEEEELVDEPEDEMEEEVLLEDEAD